MPDDLVRLKEALADRYAIERELGAGGMATVYLAEDLKHRRPVAIKVLRPELAASLGVERFVREIEIAAKLSHPHILPLHDSGEAGGFLYYVMPYVEGESLREKLGREGRMALLHGSVLRLRPPVPKRESPHPVAVGHPETGHRVENPAHELDLHPLARKGATAHTPTDHRLVSIDRVLDHASLTEARSLVPLASTEFADVVDVPIPFLQCGRGPWTQLRVASGWDEHPYGSSFTLRLGRLVDTFGIIGTIC